MMPMKKLRVSFDIDMELFARMLGAGHSDMNIQVFGTDDPRVTHTNAITDNRGGIRTVILDTLRTGDKQLSEIRIALVDHGYSAKSLNGAIHLMQENGLIKRVAFATFAITKKGESFHE
jgi:DNA-binding HxlR family transcriptional regulator